MKTLAALVLLLGTQAFAEPVRIRCEQAHGTNSAMTLGRIALKAKTGYLTASSVERGSASGTDYEFESQRDVVRDVLTLPDVDVRVELTAEVGQEGFLQNAELKLLDPYLVSFTSSKVSGRFDRPVSLTVDTPRYSIDIRCSLKN